MRPIRRLRTNLKHLLKIYHQYYLRVVNTAPLSCNHNLVEHSDNYGVEMPTQFPEIRTAIGITDE